MDLELKTEWKDALKSGKYYQGFKVLKRYDCFCALGVLGDICVRKGLAHWDDNVLCCGDSRSLYGLPDSLMKQINMDESFHNELIEWNDKNMLWFSDIANKL